MIRSTALLLPLLLCVFIEPVGAMELPIKAALKGRVQLTGSIADSACTIRVGNDNQTIVFNPAALNGLVSGDSSAQQPLNIYISDCIPPDALRGLRVSQRFKISFEGESEGKYFGTQGTAQGIAIQIKDELGKSVSPGMLLNHDMSATDILTLNYSLTLVGSGYALKPGDYTATIKLYIQHF
ncbi:MULTISPECIES: fimbrial protein [Pseudomonas]|uniref:Type 1 fimbrial protein n=1 Tax=Pseudomonas auratipiscis TaxID=3115853 RepID=A0AB35X0T6_9PSED|nr:MULTISPECIES: hypothetical protein [unclassified Pseudomonas]MEE1869157.1 hypothetical protein [Pseudomonas sp. 120P]MEE1959911.1 hypothetical protein [Pseudomonas sp. 119P]